MYNDCEKQLRTKQEKESAINLETYQLLAIMSACGQILKNVCKHFFDKSLVDKIPKKYNGFVKTAIVIYVHEKDFVLLTVTIIEHRHLMPGIK